MDKNKLNKISVYAGVHTVMIRSGVQSRIDPEIADWINAEKPKINKQGNWLYYYILNLNRYAGQDLWTRGEFMDALISALQEMGLNTDWVFSRVDVRFDQLEDTFDDQRKMHLLLIATMAKSLNMVNFWTAERALSHTELSVKAMHERAEIENYNKYEQRKDRDAYCPAMNRLEFRSHRVNDQIDVGDNMLQWISKARKAVQKNYDRVLNECNDYLMELWKKEHTDGGVKSLSEFCRKYSDTIFSRPQLEDFMKRIGKPNPHNATKAFCQKNRSIEFVSKHDLNTYLDKLETAAKAYVDGTQDGYKRVYFGNTRKVEKAA